MRVAFFATCIGDSLATRAATVAVRVLERLGHDFAFPWEQTCCGQMHVNGGYTDAGLELAGRLERIFVGHAVIVSPSSSCVGHPSIVDLLSEAIETLDKLIALRPPETLIAGARRQHPRSS
jgi:Fe-S oxidoreductase